MSEELDEAWREESDEALDEESDEELDEESDEELDEESDEDLDEESDQELDEKSDEDLHENLDEELIEVLDVGLDEELDEELDEDLDVEFDKAVFPQYKVHDVMRDLAFYILQINGGRTPAEQLALYRAGQNLTEFPPNWTTERKQPLKAHRLSLHDNKLKTLPSTFCAHELLTLLLGHNKISDVPAGFLKGIQNLRVLDLCHGEFEYLLEELGNLKHLVYLNLSHNSCLQELPESIENLRVLRNLNLSYCTRLRYLPSGVVGLESLQVLYTQHCFQLKWAERTHTEMGLRHIVMAESLGHKAKAKGVSLENIFGFEVLIHLFIEGENCQHVLLPDNRNTKLEDLRLYGFRNLKTLPAWMPDFKKLRSLSVTWCDGLERLPGSFTCRGAFPALIEFKLQGCVNLVEFPEVEGGAIPKLQTLYLNGCDSLGNLPLSLEVLTNLKNCICWVVQMILKGLVGKIERIP